MDKRRQTEEMMVDLLYETTKELLRRIRSGEATPQDISNVIKLLNNNEITVAIKKGEIPPELLEDLPFDEQGFFVIGQT